QVVVDGFVDSNLFFPRVQVGSSGIEDLHGVFMSLSHDCSQICDLGSYLDSHIMTFFAGFRAIGIKFSFKTFTDTTDHILETISVVEDDEDGFLNLLSRFRILEGFLDVRITKESSSMTSTPDNTFKCINSIAADDSNGES